MLTQLLTIAFSIVAHRLHLKFSQTSNERSLLNLKYQNEYFKIGDKEKKHFKLSKKWLLPVQIINISPRWTPKCTFCCMIHPLPNELMHLLPLSTSYMASNKITESKIHDHLNAKSQIIPGEYHTEWTLGVDSWRYWKEQEPGQWAGMSFTRTTT